MPAYKSFCWGLGTTSFRTKQFNRTIEEQLSLLDEFWHSPENSGEDWANNNALQIRYYDFMKEQGFVSGDAPRKDKDAREKTSGLVDIGLITDSRRLTEAGVALLEISRSGDFTSDNIFQIPRDSFIYLKQLLKTSNTVDGSIVRPFIVLLRVLSEFEFITMEEYTYLLPLCIDSHSTEYIIQKIRDLRSNLTTIESVIIERLMSMDNYQEALSMLLTGRVSESLICEIGMNRKSRTYDRPYYRLYQSLYNAFVRSDSSAFLSAYEATRSINIGRRWRDYLFNTVSTRAIDDNPLSCLNHTLFDGVRTESAFKAAFFKVMHMLKAKATLSDYLDLNRRYIKTTDIVIFEDDCIKLDIVPKHFFGNVIEDLYSKAFNASEKLFDNCSMQEIAPCLVENETVVINGVNAELGTAVTTVADARIALEDIRYRRLQELIDDKFTDEKLLILLDLFERRNDAQIQEMVTDDADIPTIFEYVLGIIWYKTSERQGKILDYMKLSLDADLLPKTHAAGGEADIVYEYPATDYYPEHSLLLEATLADRTNQRRMEMEPVSRHLGMHLIRTGNLNSYCVFATTYLDINVTADFRNRKSSFFYDPQDPTKYVNGMKIIPLDTSVLKSVVSCQRKYRDLYAIFETAYNADLNPLEWYNSFVRNPIINR